MTINLVNEQTSFYLSNDALGRNEFNLNSHKTQEILQMEVPLPLSPFTDSDTSSIRRDSASGSSTYSPNISQLPLEQQRKLSSSSNSPITSSNLSKNSTTLTRISTSSLVDNKTIRNNSISSPTTPTNNFNTVNDGIDLGRGEESRRPSTSGSNKSQELIILKDKSLRLSQQTINSQTSSTSNGSNSNSNNKKEGALENWKNWAKEIEARGGRSPELSSPTPVDPWSEYSSTTTVVTTTTTTTITQPRSMPLCASPTRSHVPLPLPNVQISPVITRTPHITVTTSFTNPLAPFRKKLTRSLSSGKRVSIEVQLLVELIDTLESYIKSYTSGGENSIATGFMVEVISLLKELIQVAPSVQKCIIDGAYGPLAQVSSPTSPTLPTTSNRKNSINATFTSNEISTAATWWPRRLAKDLRKVLEEVGFPTAIALKGGTSSNSYLKETQSSNYSTPRKGSVSSNNNASIRGGGGGIENLPSSPSSPHSPLSPLSPLSPAALKRKEELLEEGRKRWEAFRKRQQAASKDFDTVY